MPLSHDLTKEHSRLHLLWNKINNGEFVENYTLEKIWLEHKINVKELIQSGLKPPIDSLDSVEFLHLKFPMDDVKKSKNISLKEINLLESSLEELQLYHTLIHIEWNKIKNGKDSKMTLEEIWSFHKTNVHEMITRGLKHLTPIDELDSVEFLSKYSQPRPSNDGKDSWIHLKDFINDFGNFKYREPFIYIVGGICNHGKTKGDIDILINKDEPKNSSEDMPIKFRLMRMLPKKYWNRLHFMYSSSHGPFTNYIPLYSLECKIFSRKVMEMSMDLQRVIDPKVKKEAEASQKEDSIQLFRFFKMPKPMHGAAEDELYTKENFFKHFDEKLLPCQIDQKFDGMRAQVHSRGKEKKIYSDDGAEITQRFPTFVSELKSGNYVLDAEITGKTNQADMPRSDVAGYVHRKGPADDKPFTLNIFDIAYFKGDIHTKSLGERREILYKNIKKTAKLNVIPYKLVRNTKELWSAMSKILRKKETEGVMVKSEASSYELDGQTRKWMKYVKEYQIKAKVIEKKKVAEAEAYNYLCVIAKNTPIGRTYNTRVNVGVGSSLLISFVNLNKYTDPDTKKVWFNWWRPRVIEKTTGVASIEEANKLNKESRSLDEEKGYPKRYLAYNTDYTTQDEAAKPPLNTITVADIKPLAGFKHITHHGDMKQFYDLYFANDEFYIFDEGVCIWRSSDNYPELAKKKWKEFTGQDVKFGKEVMRVTTFIPGVRPIVAVKEKKKKKIHLTPLQQLKQEYKFPEDLCTRCGKCCFFKKELDGGRKMFTSEPCQYLEFLDDGTTKCKVYENRHMVADWCLPLDQAIVQGCLPADCPYVQNIPNYRAPLELAKKQKFAIRHHYRGKSVHADIAFERPGKKVDAYVLDDMVAREIPKPVLTLKQAIKEDKLPENFKINYKTGEIPTKQKILVQEKETKLRVFSEDISGISPPGGVGATKKYPGVFHVLDKGTYEPGARKPYFYEYFIDGNVFKGRYIFRRLPRSGKWTEAGEVGKVWFFWKPEAQIPYILSTRGISKADFPIGVGSASWLPLEFEKQIPKELKWWNLEIKREEAVSRLKEVRKLFLKQKIIKPGKKQESLSGAQIGMISSLSQEQYSRNAIANEVGCGKTTVYKYQKLLNLM